jgi:eukaryotic-like serine/threonine-protein kinase
MSDAAAIEWFDDLGPIGAGGWGAIRKVRRIRDGVFLAIKRLLPKHRASKEMRDRFAQEERLLRELQGHPNIVRIVQSYPEMSDGQGPGIALELMDGNLLDRMRKGMSHEGRLKAAFQVADALKFMHQKGVIHRDVKPQNVLLDKEGVAKLADFGCAKAPGYGVDLTRWSVGTLGYMAPEQHRPRCHADERSDIHAYGVTLFHLFLGRMPEFNDQHRILKFPGWEEVDLQFLALLMKATAESPADRYQSMAEVKAEMLRLQASRLIPGAQRPKVVPLQAKPVPQEGPRFQPSPGLTWEAVATVLIIGVIVVGGVLALRAASRAV